jgi:hypothetical protein
VVAKPLYFNFKAWRSERLTLAAESLMEAGKWEPALNTASAAYLLAPHSTRTIRLVAELLTHFNSERALDFWQLAVAGEPARDESRRALIECALRYQQLPLAEKHAAELLKIRPDARENLLSAADVAREARDYTREYRLLNRARTLFPDDAGIHFKLNRVLAAVGTEAEVRVALAGLRLDALRQDQIGLDALEFFLTRPVEEYPDRERFAQLLRHHPLASGAQIVAACALEVDAQPGARAQRLDELLGAVSARDTATKLAAADWLLRLDEHQRVLQMIPWAEAHDSPKLALAHLDALSRAGDPAALERLLALPGLPLRKELAHLFRWQALTLANPGVAADREAAAAMDAAAGNPATLSFIASRFEESARNDLAQEAFTRLRHSARFRAVALRGLLRLAQRERDTKAILGLLEQARADGVDDAGAQADVAYYQLLLKRNLPRNHQLLTRLAAEHPDRVTVFCSLALACLVDEDFTGALKAFEACDFHWRRATNGTKAIYAATLNACGRTTEAREVTNEITPETLLPEERALLGSVRDWLSKNP